MTISLKNLFSQGRKNKMNDYLLTSIIMNLKQTGSLERIFQKKYTYGQIGRTLVEALKLNYIAYENERYSVTEKGNEFIKNIEVFELKHPKIKNKHENQLSLEDIYIPKYNGGN